MKADNALHQQKLACWHLMQTRRSLRLRPTRLSAAFDALPETEAVYQTVDIGLLVGDYTLHIPDVPVDAFWSVTVHNPEGLTRAERERRLRRHCRT